MSENVFVVISSPSGGGKDTVIKKLRELFPDSARLVTTTTRDMRPGDVQGVNYNFISKDEFEEKIKNNDLLEYNIYSGNYYGIDKKVLNNTLENNKLVFTNIDVNGKISLDKNNINHISIFLLPDSIEVLKNRIITRGGVSEQDLEKRLELAKKEIKLAENYDYKVKNQDGQVDETVKEIAGIIKGIDKKG